MRSGLGRILGLRQEMQIAAECDDGEEVEAAVHTHHPDIVVMDVRMKRVDGAEATRRLRALTDAPPVSSSRPTTMTRRSPEASAPERPDSC